MLPSLAYRPEGDTGQQFCFADSGAADVVQHARQSSLVQDYFLGSLSPIIGILRANIDCKIANLVEAKYPPDRKIVI